ncbi:MAG: EexN family lipoprotein [Burkholderiales bacterium]|nr:EexN family lipoprotein [Burkholderiales bacterium]
MKQLLSMFPAFVAAVLLAACSKPAPIESVESLVANPERLKELRTQCKADHAKVGDEQCNAVAEATRRRFFGSGGPKHTPAAPAPAASAPAPKD